MHCTHLSLSNFRNYQRLELALPPQVSIVVGDNAQGKSNLLEALYFLATTRSHRAIAERELIHWAAWSESLPFARLVADVQKTQTTLRIEIALLSDPSKVQTPQPDETPLPHPDLGFLAPHPGPTQKRLKVNGVPKRAMDVVGQMNVVLFSPQDLEIVNGSPSGRRHYLDTSLCQIDATYCRALVHYNRVLLQRNHLLKLIQEQAANLDELFFWDNELIEYGSQLIAGRQRALIALDGLTRQVHGQLTGQQEQLRLVYHPSVAVQNLTGLQDLSGLGDPSTGSGQALSGLREQFRAQLRRVQKREIAQGTSVLGPHRDDLAFLVNSVDMNVYGSRGQQRTVALSLRLAEVAYMRAVVGEEPILLLDDIMSELDPARRAWVLQTIGQGQAIITATETDHFAPSFLRQATLFRVTAGQIFPL
jgi:DNA replication and repair protein RecF